MAQARIQHWTGDQREATTADLWSVGRFQGATGMVVPTTDGTDVVSVPWWIRLLPRSLRARWYRSL